LVLSGRIVNYKRLDYVALGHIHKHQSLSPAGSHPPIIYPGSIEKIDFGEVREDKGFVLAQVSKGQTDWEFTKLKTRRFLDFKLDNLSADTFMEEILRQLPEPEKVAGAICRVQLSYPRDWEPLLDDNAIVERFKEALSIQIQKHRQVEKRARLGDTAAVESLTPTELLDTYWQTIGLAGEETAVMQTLAEEVLKSVSD
jgi:exonuclease SbcD